MRRIRIRLAYDGGAFHGWQIQPGLPTIQGILEEILSGMEGAPVAVAGSGRTDAGVHALEQVAAFSLANPIPLLNLRRAMNRLLPHAIRVRAAEEVHEGFHPRFDAKAKTYEYRIVTTEVCSPFEWPYVLHHPYPLDEDRMILLARAFEGEHDFTAFAAADDRDAEEPCGLAPRTPLDASRHFVAARGGRTGASRPVPPRGERDSSWYSSSTFTDQMSWCAPKRFSTVSIAVYMEWSWLLYLCMPLRPMRCRPRACSSK